MTTDPTTAAGVTLTALTKAVDRAALDRPVSVPRVRNLAPVVEAFAAAHPELDPDTHRRLLVKLARALEPRTPAHLAAARVVLGPRVTADQVLAEARRHVETLGRATDRHATLFADAAWALAAAVDHLDGILSSAGALPAAWRAGRPEVVELARRILDRPNTIPDTATHDDVRALCELLLRGAR